MLGEERVYKHEMVHIYTAVSFDITFYLLTFITLYSNIRKVGLLYYGIINLERKKRNASASVKTLQIRLCSLFQYIIIF